VNHLPTTTARAPPDTPHPHAHDTVQARPCAVLSVLHSCRA
jgi:hypothetical protein